MAKTLEQQIAENSKNWHTSDDAGKKQLEQANKDLHKQLDTQTGSTSTFNPTSGTWATTPPPAEKSTTPKYTNGSSSGGSSAGVQTFTPEQQQIKDKMNANSIAWHAANAEQQKLLAAENKALAAQLGGDIAFDPGSGKWAGAAQQETAPSTDDMKKLLDAWNKNATNQSNQKIDYAVNQAVTDLERATADAQPMFREQQEQTARDEAQGLNNSALYAELRGDKGGIGKEQYNSVQNTAAQNRQSVSSAQVKLASDTQRQIADLRAKGEFEKADAVLAIAQSSLTQLMELERWAADYNLSAQQFQESIRQWDKEFQQNVDRYNTQQTGYLPNGNKTLSAQGADAELLKTQGFSLLESGFLPAENQLAAMGWTKAQAQQALNVQALESAKKTTQKSSGGGYADYNLDGLFEAAKESGNPLTFMKQPANYKKYGLSSAPVTDEYNAWEREQKASSENPTNGKESSAAPQGVTGYLQANKVRQVPQEVTDYLRKLEVRSNSNALIASLIEGYYRDGTIDAAQTEALLHYYKLA